MDMAAPDMLNPDAWDQPMMDQKQADLAQALLRLKSFVDLKGDITGLLEEDVVKKVGSDAVKEWKDDCASISAWREQAQRGITQAAQEREGTRRDANWDGMGADVNFPLLTISTNEWASRASAGLVRNDSLIGIKVYNPPGMRPSPAEIAAAAPPPKSPQDAQASQAAIQQDQAEDTQLHLQAMGRNARGERVAHYMNELLFYGSRGLENWENDTDVLLHQLAVIGSGFRKTYMGPDGLTSEYCSPLNLTVHRDTKSMQNCPRITHDFKLYSYQIKQGQRAEDYREYDFETEDGASEQRQIIEQHRYEDLDEDGFPEPYIVTVDVDAGEVMRIQPAFDMSDVKVNQRKHYIKQIVRWMPFSSYAFLPDIEGGFYGTGLWKLLEPLVDIINGCSNQILDAETRAILGGGFVAQGVRFAAGGQAGVVDARPGQYTRLDTGGIPLSEAIYEHTVPNNSGASFQMLQYMVDQAKAIASIKDVMTGDQDPQAPVGTTMAALSQALQMFSSIYKRVLRGFKQEFEMMYLCIQKFPTDEMRFKYNEITKGDLDQDFSGDGTDIQPVADPNVITKAQRIAHAQTIMQLSQSPLGQAAGMLQAVQAQTQVRDILDTLDTDRPERYITNIQPDPLTVAQKQAEVNAQQQEAPLKQAQVTKAQADAQSAASMAEFNKAKAAREISLIQQGQDNHVDSLWQKSFDLNDEMTKRQLGSSEKMGNKDPFEQPGELGDEDPAKDRNVI